MLESEQLGAASCKNCAITRVLQVTDNRDSSLRGAILGSLGMFPFHGSHEGAVFAKEAVDHSRNAVAVLLSEKETRFCESLARPVIDSA
jgi:hypothetical protein